MEFLLGLWTILNLALLVLNPVVPNNCIVGHFLSCSYYHQVCPCPQSIAKRILQIPNLPSAIHVAQPDPGLPVKSESVPKILWDTNPWWTDHLRMLMYT